MKTIKIAFVGSVNSGKTCLVKRCLDQGFALNSTQPTLGINFHSTQLTIGNMKCKCTFIDSQGFDNNKGILSIPLFQRFHGFIVVYDVTEPASFQNSKQCYLEIVQHCKPQCQNVALIGNKIDLQDERKVKYSQAYQFCCKNKINYSETSAMQNDYVKNMIETIATNLICSGKFKMDDPQSAKKLIRLTSAQVNEAKRKGCWQRFKSWIQS